MINVASCDDTDLTRAVLEGMKARFEATGRRGVLVHTSGALVIADGAHGVLDPETAAHPFDVRICPPRAVPC